MTLSSPYAEKLEGRLPSEAEQKSANQLRQILASYVANDGNRNLKILDYSGESVDIALMPALSNLLMELLRHIGKGDAVTLVPVGQMLTTQQAADILNVSRPYLVGLIDKGLIEHDKVGRHRRIKADDLFKYKQQRDSERAKALDELAEIDSDFI